MGFVIASDSTVHCTGTPLLAHDPHPAMPYLLSLSLSLSHSDIESHGNGHRPYIPVTVTVTEELGTRYGPHRDLSFPLP